MHKCDFPVILKINLHYKLKCNSQNSTLTSLRERRDFAGDVAYNTDISASHFHNQVLQDGAVHLLRNEGVLDQVGAEDWDGNVVQKRDKSVNPIVKFMIP